MTADITRETLLRVFTEMHETEVYDFFIDIIEARDLDWVIDTGDADEDGLIEFPHQGMARSPYEDTSKWKLLIKAGPSNTNAGIEVLAEMFPFRREEVVEFMSKLPTLLYHPQDGKTEFISVTARRMAERLRSHGFVVELH